MTVQLFNQFFFPLTKRHSTYFHLVKLIQPEKENSISECAAAVVFHGNKNPLTFPLSLKYCSRVVSITELSRRRAQKDLHTFRWAVLDVAQLRRTAVHRPSCFKLQSLFGCIASFFKKKKGVCELTVGAWHLMLLLVFLAL